MSTGKPEVDFPGGDPPSGLQITEIWEGSGKVAGPGDTVRVHYVGVAYSTGEEFDASWDRGEPLEFRLGAGRVIAGWDQGQLDRVAADCACAAHDGHGRGGWQREGVQGKSSCGRVEEKCRGLGEGGTGRSWHYRSAVRLRGNRSPYSVPRGL